MDEPPIRAEDPASEPRRTRSWRWLISAVAVVLLLLAYNLWVFLPVRQALRGETGASTIAYRNWLVDPNAIVFDVRSVEGTSSMTDITRRLFKAAEALKDRHFDHVYLAYRGERRFMLTGDYFQEIGRSYSYQNPVFLVRTMPEHVMNLDGSPAFGTWTGGLIGVVGRQFEDMNAFHRRWYVSDELSRL